MFSDIMLLFEKKNQDEMMSQENEWEQRKK